MITLHFCFSKFVFILILILNMFLQKNGKYIVYYNIILKENVVLFFIFEFYLKETTKNPNIWESGPYVGK